MEWTAPSTPQPTPPTHAVESCPHVLDGTDRSTCACATHRRPLATKRVLAAGVHSQRRTRGQPRGFENTRTVNGSRNTTDPQLSRHWLRARAANGARQRHRRSNGLLTPRPPRFNTCVYIIVVLTSACPSNSCTVRMSYPSSSRCVANEWRNVWQPTRLASPAAFAACAVVLPSDLDGGQ